MIRSGLRTALFLFAMTSLQAQTGTAVPALAPYDTFVRGLLSRYRIPGASIAITQNGRLVFARGYGVMDANGAPVQPTTLFRIASLSKVITSVAVMKLVEQGKLSLDGPAFALLPDLLAPPGTTPDPRLRDITIRQLLAHSGGWDRNKTPGGFDPMFTPERVVAALRVASPPSTENIIRYMMGQPLDFTPGTKFSFSNFGYVVLGRIIERVTQKPYEVWVRENLLLPAGITGIRIGQTLSQGQAAGEGKYFGPANVPSAFADVPGPVEAAYGGWSLESMDAHGGWIASAIDYAKFMNAIDGRRGTRLLSPASVTTLTARPSTPEFQTSNGWYALGLTANILGNWWHDGGLPGTATFQIRTNDGFQYVLLLNSQGLDPNLYFEMDTGFWDARARVTAWPTTDQFTSFPDADPSVAGVTPSILGREGVVNGATFDRGIVSGSWFTVFGANLSPGTRLWSGSDFVGNALPQALDGIRVTVDGKPAFVYYISPTQINAQAPDGLTPGWKRVEVTRNGISSGAVLAYAAGNAPGALTYSSGGRSFAVATTPSGVVLGDPSLAAGLATCKPGDTVIIYTTALTTSPAGTAAPVQAPLTNVTVTIGGRTATLLFAGLISPGLFQINAIVPTVANGDQELLITVAGKSSPNGVVLNVRN